MFLTSTQFLFRKHIRDYYIVTPGYKLIKDLCLNQGEKNPMVIKVCYALVCGKNNFFDWFSPKDSGRSLSSVMNSLIFPVFRIWGRGREEEDLSRNTFSILNLTLQPLLILEKSFKKSKSKNDGTTSVSTILYF